MIKKILGRRLKNWIWRRASSQLQLKRVLCSGIEIEIRSFADWCVYNDIFVEGEYDPAIDESLKSCGSENFRWVDLGANVGFFTLRVLDRMRRLKGPEMVKTKILMVEGSPSLDEEIKRRTQHVRNAATDLTILNGLVGKKEGSATFQFASSQMMNRINRSNTGSALQYVNLDPYLEQFPEIDLLKCDIEGSEFDFLNSYSPAIEKTKHLIIEFHLPECPPAEGVDRVKKKGFTIARELYQQGEAATWFFSRR
jgi:FkbM family methyltransferase